MAMAMGPPDPPLNDGVVSLRPWGEPGDVAVLTTACNDPAIAAFLDQIPSPYTEEDARAYIELCRIGWRQGSPTNFAIVESGEPVGAIGVRWLDGLDAGTAEVGYWMSPDARGRGLCSRALRLVSRWVLEEARAPRLQLRADEVNLASNKVAQNAGFTREGVLRSSRFNARLGRRVDFVMYSLLPGEI